MTYKSKSAVRNAAEFDVLHVCGPNIAARVHRHVDRLGQLRIDAAPGQTVATRAVKVSMKLPIAEVP